jgi:DHA2 family lincomycin resistance protein-like MFS transporter
MSGSQADQRVIWLLLFSTFVVILNETIMGVAIPHLMHDLHITANAAQWLTTAFLLTMATVIPVTGFLLQRLDTRPVFILAMVCFSAGTLACALAPDLPWLVAGRVVQAVGTAIMMPLLMTTIMTLVPEETRGKTMGDISIVISVAPAIGPTISGLILGALDWRWMFWLVLPIALGSLALGARLISNVGAPKRVPIDLVSVPLAALGFGGLVYGLSEYGAVPAAVGTVALVLFVARQLVLQRDDRALLDLRTLASRNFSISLAMMAICMVSLFGVFLLLPIYVQHVLGFDTLRTGLMMLPGGLVMGLMAPPVGRWYDRRGPRVLIVPGTLMVFAVLAWMATLTEHTPFALLVAAHVVLSVGLALTFTPLFTASLGSLPKDLYAHGSAMVGTVQQVAGAAGAALMVALMTRQAERLAAGGAPAALATVGGIRDAFVWGAAIAALAVVAAFFVRKPAPAAA